MLQTPVTHPGDDNPTLQTQKNTTSTVWDWVFIGEKLLPLQLLSLQNTGEMRKWALIKEKKPSKKKKKLLLNIMNIKINKYKFSQWFAFAFLLCIYSSLSETSAKGLEKTITTKLQNNIFFFLVFQSFLESAATGCCFCACTKKEMKAKLIRFVFGWKNDWFITQSLEAAVFLPFAKQRISMLVWNFMLIK